MSEKQGIAQKLKQLNELSRADAEEAAETEETAVETEAAAAEATEDSGTEEAAADAEEEKEVPAAEDLLKEEDIDGFHVRRFGEPMNRVMIAVMPGAGKMYDGIAEMAALCAVPIGYQVIQVTFPVPEDPEKVTPILVNGYVSVLHKIYDGIRREPVAKEIVKSGTEKGVGRFKSTTPPEYLKEKHIYLFAYDLGAAIGMKAFADRTLTRAYLVSPVLKLPYEENTAVWDHETEVLYGIRDAVVPKKEMRRFEKEGKVHVTEVEMGHEISGERELLEIRRWLSGRRQKNYTRGTRATMIIVIGMVLGSYVGQFLFHSSSAGILLGLVFAGGLWYLITKRK